MLRQHQSQIDLEDDIDSDEKRPALLPIVELILSITLWLIGLVVNHVIGGTTQFALILLINLKAN